MKATITFINYSKELTATKSYTVPNTVTEKTRTKFEKIDEDMMNLAKIEDCEDWGCEVKYNGKTYTDIFELLDSLE